MRSNALIVLAGQESPARAAAAACGIPVIELIPGGGPAGLFTLAGRPAAQPAPDKDGREIWIEANAAKYTELFRLTFS